MFSSLQAYNNAEHWVQSFKLVRKIVGGVDYKGVREIMKNCIEKASLLPQGSSDKWKIFSIKRYFYSDSDPWQISGISCGVTAQCESLRSVLGYIFDRNAALLPGYFIVNEILKSYPENKTWPHWSLVQMVSDFLNSFRPGKYSPLRKTVWLSDRGVGPM